MACNDSGGCGGGCGVGGHGGCGSGCHGDCDSGGCGGRSWSRCGYSCGRGRACCSCGCLESIPGALGLQARIVAELLAPGIAC